jgi:hypothetical protein
LLKRLIDDAVIPKEWRFSYSIGTTGWAYCNPLQPFSTLSSAGGHLESVKALFTTYVHKFLNTYNRNRLLSLRALKLVR